MTYRAVVVWLGVQWGREGAQLLSETVRHPSATLTLTPFRPFCLRKSVLSPAPRCCSSFCTSDKAQRSKIPLDHKLNADLTLHSMRARCRRHSSVDGGSRAKDKSSAHRRRHSSVAREETTRRRSSSGSRSGKQQQSRRRSAEGGEGKGRRRRSAENERTQHSR